MKYVFHEQYFLPFKIIIVIWACIRIYSSRISGFPVVSSDQQIHSQRQRTPECAMGCKASRACPPVSPSLSQSSYERKGYRVKRPTSYLDTQLSSSPPGDWSNQGTSRGFSLLPERIESAHSDVWIYKRCRSCCGAKTSTSTTES